MPDRWNSLCRTHRMVCRSTSEQEAKVAIIVLTAKEVGPTDSYEAYTNVNTPQTINFSGRPILLNCECQSSPRLTIKSGLMGFIWAVSSQLLLAI